MKINCVHVRASNFVASEISMLSFIILFWYSPIIRYRNKDIFDAYPMLKLSIEKIRAMRRNIACGDDPLICGISNKSHDESMYTTSTVESNWRSH